MTGPDPIAREMAALLCSGQARPGDLLRLPEYREVLERGLRRMGELIEDRPVRRSAS